MNNNDLWEKREKDRKRFLKKSNTSVSLMDILINYKVVAVFFLCLSLFLVSEMPIVNNQMKTIVTIVSNMFLLVMMIINKTNDRRMLFVLNAIFMINFAFLIVIGVYSNNSVLVWGEMVRVLSGALIFLYCYTGIKDNEKIVSVIIFLLPLLALSIYDISFYAKKNGLGNHFSSNNVSLLGTHESIGSLLALLLPIPVTISLSGKYSERVKLFMYAISLIIGFAWIMVRCRSAWVGGAVGLIFVMLLYLKYLNKYEIFKKKRVSSLKTIIASPSLWIIGGMITIALVGGIAPALSSRAASLLYLLDGSSLDGRLIMWNGALRMLSEKPFLGWGLGGYLLLQGQWTNLGDGPEHVIKYGTGHQNIAHNYYVQLAADTGCIGLFLFLFSILFLIMYSVKALNVARGHEDKIFLIAFISSILGALVEMNGSPAFQFCGNWCYFWMIVGMLTITVYKVHQETPILVKKSAIVILAVTVGAICGGLVWYGHRLSDPHGTPRGVFQLVERTKGPYHPGDEVRWRAMYSDSKGVDQGSNPATRWVLPIWVATGDRQPNRPVDTQKWALSRASLSDSDLLRGYSEMSIRLPQVETGIVQIQALFYDEFGRKYRSSRVVEVVKK